MKEELSLLFFLKEEFLHPGYFKVKFQFETFNNFDLENDET